jgi:hypothetical protein
MTCEDQVFLINVVVSNMTWEIVVLNVISRPTCVVVELNAIAKIHKYRGLHEGHHFILIALELHDAPKHDIYRFIMECACFFHDR